MLRHREDRPPAFRVLGYRSLDMFSTSLDFSLSLWTVTSLGLRGISLSHTHTQEPGALPNFGSLLIHPSCSGLGAPLWYPGQADRRPSSARLPSCHSQAAQPCQDPKLSVASSRPDFPKQKAGHAI